MTHMEWAHFFSWLWQRRKLWQRPKKSVDPTFSYSGDWFRSDNASRRRWSLRVGTTFAVLLLGQCFVHSSHGTKQRAFSRLFIIYQLIFAEKGKSSDPFTEQTFGVKNSFASEWGGNVQVNMSVKANRWQNIGHLLPRREQNFFIREAQFLSISFFSFLFPKLKGGACVTSTEFRTEKGQLLIFWKALLLASSECPSLAALSPPRRKLTHSYSPAPLWDGNCDSGRFPCRHCNFFSRSSFFFAILFENDFSLQFEKLQRLSRKLGDHGKSHPSPLESGHIFPFCGANSIVGPDRKWSHFNRSKLSPFACCCHSLHFRVFQRCV